MLLNFTQIMIWFTRSFTLLLFFITPINLNSSYSNVKDLYSRILENDFPLNSFFYLWTSFWYIPLLLTVVSLSYLLNLNSILSKAKLVSLSGGTCVVFLLLIDYWVLNIHGHDVLNNSDNFNNLLSNSINKYHPGIFYYVSTSLISYLVLIGASFTLTKLTFTSNCFSSIIYRKRVNLLVVTIATLSLGGWWALQEGSWGGWWNWDPSEVFGLLFIFFFTWLIHSNTAKQSPLLYHFDLRMWVGLIVVAYVFIQLNFDLVSHNFGTKIDQFIDNSQFFIMIILWAFVLLGSRFNRGLDCLRQLLTRSVYVYYPIRLGNQTHVWLTVVLLTTLVQVSLSLLPLLNDFLWKMAGINVSNFLGNWSYYNLITITLLLLFFWSPKSSSLFYFIEVIIEPLYVITFYLFSVLRLRVPLILHLALILFFIASTVNSVFILTYWGSGLGIVYPGRVLNVHNLAEIISLNTSFIEMSNCYLLSSYFTAATNFLLNDSSLEVYSFLFNVTNFFQNQILLLGSSLFPFTVNVHDVMSQPLLNALLVFFYLSHRICQTKELIVF